MYKEGIGAGRLDRFSREIASDMIILFILNKWSFFLIILFFIFFDVGLLDIFKGSVFGFGESICLI